MIRIFVRPSGPGRRRLKGAAAPLARAASKEPARIAVERQRRDVAQVAWVKTDVGQLAAIHARKRSERRSGGGDAERPSGRSGRCGADRSPNTAFGNHGA
jgi:hypothetical protein